MIFFLLDSIYDAGKLKCLRSRVSFYIHGHSAGGTNPSPVEAMRFGKAVLGFDCNYTRSSTEDKAIFFGNSEELQQLIVSLDKTVAEKVRRDMLEIANRRYTWCIVAQQYFALLQHHRKASQGLTYSLMRSRYKWNQFHFHFKSKTIRRSGRARHVFNGGQSPPYNWPFTELL